MINSGTMNSELDSKRKVHHLGGGKEKQDQQRKKGKFNAFERTDAIFDLGTFCLNLIRSFHDCDEFD